MLLPIRDNTPTREKVPIVTLTIISVNIIIFLLFSKLSFTLPEHVISTFGYESINPAFKTILTSLFFHSNILCLVINMYYLWLFANGIEGLFGTGRFIIYYILCGIMGNMALTVYGSPITISAFLSVGTSGIISCLLGSYLVYFPGSEIQTAGYAFIRLRYVSIKAWIFILLWLVMNIMDTKIISLGLNSIHYQVLFAEFGIGIGLAFVFAKQKEDTRSFTSIFKILMRKTTGYFSKDRLLYKGEKAEVMSVYEDTINTCLKLGKVRKVARLYIDLTSRYPDIILQAPVQFLVGSALGYVKKYENAIEAYTKFMEKYPHHPKSDWTLFNMGRIYLNQYKNFSKAKECFIKLVSEYPLSSLKDEAHEYLATIRLYEDEYQ